MAKDPKLKLVSGTGASGSQPPRKLGEHGLKLWKSIQAEYNITDTGGVELLAQAAAALDRAEALAERINADGETISTSRGGLRSHPCLKDELASRAFVCRTLQRLGLNVEALQPGAGRPGGKMSG